MTDQVSTPSSSSSLESAGMNIFTVDSFANGIAFGQHKLEPGQDPREAYSLKIEDTAGVKHLRSRYLLHKENPLLELEKHLMRLSSQGILGSSVIYFGTTTDPFFPFESKFDASMRFLEIFKRYTPGMLIVQTRSPLVVIALPVFGKLGARVAITLGLETCDEEAVRRYTPGLPRVNDRIKTARALRRFGVEVTLQASPVLPYGDWRNDAGRFADLLVENSDYLYLSGMTDGSERSERQVRGTEVAKRLADDRKFHWLRPDCAEPLLKAIQARAPERLNVPIRKHLAERQVKMFAA